ncbi:MAG: type II secretion system protein J [Gemmatimonadales bacterium]|jgi:type II secretion system protein I
MKTRAGSSAGFTLVEVLIALAMLSVVLLAAAASTTKYLGVITRNRMRIQAAAVADAQIAKVRVSPAYDSLTVRFDSTRSGVPFAGYTRSTRVIRTGAGSTTDVTKIRVTVSGPELSSPVVRYATIAAP